VYLGEYAAGGNKLRNAIDEAGNKIGIKCNADIVIMASYAPILAKKDHTQSTTDMIFFDNKSNYLTPNYHVQKMFSTNYGDTYYENIISTAKDTTLSASSIKDTKTGDIILKMVSTGKKAQNFKINLDTFTNFKSDSE